VADAVVFGSLLISLLKHADRVTSASLAQLVNVIAPIMTEPGGPAWRQTTFFPFALTSHLATGSTLKVQLTSDTYTTDAYGEVALVDAVATHDAESGTTAVFLVNRSQTEAATVTIDLAALGGVSVVDAQTLSDDDIQARNTLDAQDRVGLRPTESVVVSDNTVTVTLPPVSWTALSLA
jgi:alpha-N-arabinofuranosidase